MDEKALWRGEASMLAVAEYILFVVFALLVYREYKMWEKYYDQASILLVAVIATVIAVVEVVLLFISNAVVILQAIGVLMALMQVVYLLMLAIGVLRMK